MAAATRRAARGRAVTMAIAAPARQTWLLDLLECRRCAGRFVARDAALVCAGCGERVPVRDGIPIFVETAADPVSRQTQSSFGYEWTQFDDWRPSGHTNFADYFDGFDLGSLAGAAVLDAGCGMGRHARFIAPHAARLVACDFSAAIDAAARNLAEFPNVACVRADIQALPFGDGSLDLIYSLGVLHHLADTSSAIRSLVRKLRAGGRLRIYVYWSQSGLTRRLLQLVGAARRVTIRLPHPILRSLCWALSIGLTAAVITPYRILSRLGIRLPDRAPLVVYTKYPFRVLYNDQFDRFSAPIEKRYTADEARALLESAGLTGVRVIERFGWIVEGRKP